MKAMLTLIAGSTLLLSQVGYTAGPGDAAAGEAKSASCAACHGPTGNGDNPTFPILAGQYRDYLVQALTDYKNGGRNNAIMKGFATGLSKEDILDLAAFYSSQESSLQTPKAN